MPGADSARGRGLPLVAMLASSVSIEETAAMTMVKVQFAPRQATR
jgi:hypothetical protein